MTTRRPTLVVTMGDPAGIGPEIVARAVASPAMRRTARLLVAGDPEIMQRTGQILVAAQLAAGYDLADIDGKRPKPLTLDSVR